MRPAPDSPGEQPRSKMTGGRGAKVRAVRLAKAASLASLFALAVLLVVAAVRTVAVDAGAGLELARWEKIDYVSADLSGEQRAQLISNFREAIQIPTVSYSETSLNTTALRDFSKLLRKAFPAVFSSHLVTHEIVGEYSHLFWVAGSDLSLVPYMLLAHIDVVPANESDGWDAPPFSAKEIDGFIYGRGTIDDKQSVMGIMQALEYLLQRGYSPQRGFYIGLGHDEEVGGVAGAVSIVNALKERSVLLEFVLDEGLAVLDGIISGLNGPAALIGISEKGQATVKLSVSTPPGHSSMPPAEGSIGILAAAVKRLEDNPLPRLFGYGPERGTFEHLAHKFGLPLRFIMSNLWLFGPLLSRVMELRPETNAFVRTTTAITMFNSGVKVNVLPSNAEAVVNLRIHSAQTLKEVLDLIEATVADERVKIEVLGGFDPLPVSDYSNKAFGYQILKKTALEQFPQVTVAPGICVGNTDSRHYTELTKDIYRFAPTWFKPGDPQRFHGVNERISKKNYEEMVMFYFRLIQNCDVKDLPSPHTANHDL